MSTRNFKSPQSINNTKDFRDNVDQKINRLFNKSPFQSVLVYDFVTNPDIFDQSSVSNLKLDTTATSKSRVSQAIRQKVSAQKSNSLGELYRNERGVKDKVKLDLMPTNSVIGYNLQNSSEELEVFFPFFPHISLPVKAGETVWVFYDIVAGKKVDYWVSR